MVPIWFHGLGFGVDGVDVRPHGTFLRNAFKAKVHSI